ERLEGRSHHHRLAARHAALGAARVVGAADESVATLLEVDLVVHLRAGTARGREAEADLDPLGGLHPQERVGEAAIELAVALRVSRWLYLSTPARSAWPGRGRVTARFGSRSSRRGDIFFSQLRQSRFSIQRVIGEPSDSPQRTPERISTWSCSIFMRPPRP